MDERLSKRLIRTLKWNKIHQLALTSAPRLLHDAKTPSFPRFKQLLPHQLVQFYNRKMKESKEGTCFLGSLTPKYSPRPCLVARSSSGNYQRCKCRLTTTKSPLKETADHQNRPRPFDRSNERWGRSPSEQTKVNEIRELQRR